MENENCVIIFSTSWSFQTCMACLIVVWSYEWIQKWIYWNLSYIPGLSEPLVIKYYRQVQYVWLWLKPIIFVQYKTELLVKFYTSSKKWRYQATILVSEQPLVDVNDWQMILWPKMTRCAVYQLNRMFCNTKYIFACNYAEYII